MTHTTFKATVRTASLLVPVAAFALVTVLAVVQEAAARWEIALFAAVTGAGAAWAASLIRQGNKVDRLESKATEIIQEMRSDMALMHEVARAHNAQADRLHISGHGQTVLIELEDE